MTARNADSTPSIFRLATPWESLDEDRDPFRFGDAFWSKVGGRVARMTETETIWGPFQVLSVLAGPYA